MFKKNIGSVVANSILSEEFQFLHIPAEITFLFLQMQLR